MAVEEHTVCVNDKDYSVTISRTSKRAWVAIGDYMGKRVEVIGSSATNAAQRWAAAARCKDKV